MQRTPTWTRAVARLISQLDSERFPAALRALLELECAFDSMVVTHYPPNAQPVALFHDLDDVQAAITVQFYATGPYLLDPFYQLCRKGTAPGIYHLPAVAGEAFYRSQYYRTFYRKIRISDEVGILIRDPGEGWIVVSLARLARRPRFSPDDLAALERIYEIVAAAALHYWSDPLEDVVETDLGDRLGTFGLDILSPREAEILQLVLQGHSSRSLAMYLGISEGTVKVHRHNAYSKLGISTQAELFSLAARHFVAHQA